MQLCSDTPADVLDVGNSNVSWSAKTPTRAAQVLSGHRAGRDDTLRSLARAVAGMAKIVPTGAVAWMVALTCARGVSGPATVSDSVLVVSSYTSGGSARTSTSHGGSAACTRA